MRIIGNNPAADAAEITAVASGTLPSGQPVIVNANGTVSVAAETAVSQAVGTPTVFQIGNTESTSAAYDANAQRVVVAYLDEPYQLGKAVVGTVSGTDISFGTPVTFQASNVSWTSVVYDANAQKVVIAYQKSEQGTAIVGTVSGTSISFGSPVVFENDDSSYIGATFDSNASKVVIAYRSGISGQAYGRFIVGTVSGTSISFGSATVYNSASTSWISSTFDSLNNKVVVAYRGATSGYGEAKVATVSGTSISFGSSTVFSTQTTGGTSEISAVFDSSSNKVVIGWQDGTDSNKGAAVVGTVSETSISFGSKVFFADSASGDISGTFDSNANKVVFFYRDNSNSNQGTLNSGTVSGTSISFGTEAIFETGATYKVSSTFDSNAQKVVVAYRDNNDSLNGKAAVFEPSYTSTNLTAENFIGFSGGAVGAAVTSQALGSSAVFESADADNIGATFDSNSNKVVIAYKDNGNSRYGTAVVGTVDPSDNSISFGTPVVFESADTRDSRAVFDSNSNKVVIVYGDNGNTRHGTAIVGTVSGTGISFGSAVVFESATTYSISATFDSNLNKVVIAYHDGGNNGGYGTAIVGTVSGTAISFGSAAVFETATVYSTSSTFDSNANKVLISYRDAGNSLYGTSIVATVSGTSISFGSAAVFEAANVDEISSAFDSTNNKVVITYIDDGNSLYGTAIVATISGTSVSFGSATVFANNGSVGNVSAVFDTNANKIVVSYKETGSPVAIGSLSVGTVSGTDISFTTPVVFLASVIDAPFSTFDSNSNKVVIAYAQQNNSSYGTGIVFQSGFTTITRDEVASGSNAVIDIGSAISTNQVSLTAGQQYFVQTNGTLGLTAGSPSVIAGTAVSSTDIIVKG